LVLCCLFAAYFLILHSMVEGGGRHHIGTLWCYALLAAISLAGARQPPVQNE
jgi:hypothetical protein